MAFISKVLFYFVEQAFQPKAVYAQAFSHSGNPSGRNLLILAAGFDSGEWIAAATEPVHCNDSLF